MDELQLTQLKEDGFDWQAFQEALTRDIVTAMRSKTVLSLGSPSAGYRVTRYNREIAVHIFIEELNR